MNVLLNLVNSLIRFWSVPVECRVSSVAVRRKLNVRTPTNSELDKRAPSFGKFGVRSARLWNVTMFYLIALSAAKAAVPRSSVSCPQPYRLSLIGHSRALPASVRSTSLSLVSTQCMTESSTAASSTTNFTTLCMRLRWPPSRRGTRAVRHLSTCVLLQHVKVWLRSLWRYQISTGPERQPRPARSDWSLVCAQHCEIH